MFFKKHAAQQSDHKLQGNVENELGGRS
jgi:hypothetical protein